MSREVKFSLFLPLVLLVTMTAAMRATTRTEATTATMTTKTQNTEGLEASLQKEDKQEKDGETKSDALRFFGAFSTTTRTMMMMMTSTVPLTCLSSANTGTTCAGRRRRKRSHSLLKNVDDDGWVFLSLHYCRCMILALSSYHWFSTILTALIGVFAEVWVFRIFGISSQRCFIMNLGVHVNFSLRYPGSW